MVNNTLVLTKIKLVYNSGINNKTYKMMRKIILSTLATVLMLGGGVIALAETDVQADAAVNTTVEARVEPKGLLQRIKALVPVKAEVKKEVRTEVKENIQEQREENVSTTKTDGEAEALIERKISNRFDKMTARFEATIVREESIMARISSRIEKIKSAGGKTEVSEKLVAEAKIHLSEARTAYENLKVVVNAAISAEVTASTTTRANLEGIKKATAEVEKHLREAHKALVKAVASLRGVSTTIKLQATTTAEINN